MKHNRRTTHGLKPTAILSLSILLALLLAILFIYGWPSHDKGTLRLTKTNPATMGHLLDGYGKMALGFEMNLGQSEERVDFLARGKGYNLYLMPNEAVLTFHRKRPGQVLAPMKAVDEAVVVSMRIDGGNSEARASGVDLLPGIVHYYIGNSPEKWRTGIPIYAGVRYEEIYPGIDLHYYGNRHEMEYDFEIAPGADPRRISLSFTGVDSLEIDSDGSLILRAPGGTIRNLPPRLWQEVEGRTRVIQGGYVQTGTSRVSFEVGDYDRHRRLIIDPVLVYSTYFGMQRNDEGFDVAVDAQGSAYIVGTTNSEGLPAANSYAGSQGSRGWTTNAFVMKLKPDGSWYDYCTYLGGSGLITDAYQYGDYGRGIAVDKMGNAYLAGETFSGNFPVKDAIQPTQPSLTGDAFITKLNGDGTLNWSTYHGGRNVDGAFDVAVDDVGAVYLTGYTGNTSEEFPTTSSAWQKCTASTSHPEAFVTKINESGSQILFRSCLADDNSYGQSIAVDAVGNVYVAGYGDGNLSTTPTAFQPARKGNIDAFVVKLNSSGTFPVFATWLGGSQYEASNVQIFGREEKQISLAVGPDDTVYVAGYTNSTDFPMPVNPDGAWQRSYQGGSWDAYLARLSAGGSVLLYSTYLGGSGADLAYGIAVNNSGKVYLTGQTTSSDFPRIDPLQAGHGGSGDVFVLRLDIPGNAPDFSTLLGGSSNEIGHGIAIDAVGDAYITGWAVSNFPTTAGAMQPAPGGGVDSIVAKIGFQAAKQADLKVAMIDDPDPVRIGQNLTLEAIAINFGPDTATGVVFTSTLLPDATVVSVNTSRGSCQVKGNVTCELGSIPNGSDAIITIVLKPAKAGNFATTVTAVGRENDPIPATNTWTESTTVTAPDLVVSKAGNPAQILLCQKSDWTIVVTNKGGAPAEGVTLNDTLPADVTFISATSTQGSCSGTGTIACALGSLAQNATAMVTIRVQPNLVGQFTNTVVVAANDPDANPNDNTATGVITVSMGPVISSVTPAEAPSGAAHLELKIEGNGFTPGTAISFKPSDGIEIIPPVAPNYGYVSPTELRVSINIAADAVLSEREVYVTRPDEACGGNRPFNIFTVIGIPAISISPENHDFGTVSLGENRTATLTIGNPGNYQLSLYAVTSSNPHFKVDLPQTPYKIAAGGSATVTATFQPTAPGEHLGTLLFCGNAYERPAAPVQLRGNVAGIELKEILKADDGTAEIGAFQDGLLMVNRLTPSSYPATLQTLRIFIAQFQGLPSPVGNRIRLVAFADPAGTGQPPPNHRLLVDQQVIIPEIPANGGFIEFPVQVAAAARGLSEAAGITNSLTIGSGDLYLGFQAPSPSNGVVFAGDSNGPQQQRTFLSQDNGSSYQKFAGLTNQQGTVTPANIMIQGQVGGVGICSYSITPSSQAFPESGGPATASVSAPDGCQWTAASNVDWVTIDPAGSGSGNGRVNFTVAAGSSPRRGILMIAGQSFTVAQAEQVASVSSASYRGTGLAGEAIAAAFGLELATGVEVAATVPLPTTLLGTQVKVRDSLGIERLAPLFFVSPQQINYQIPPGTASGTVTVTITSGSGKVSVGTGQSDAVAPGLFTVDASGAGMAAAYALRIKPDGSQIYESLYSCNASDGKCLPIPIDLGSAEDKVFLVLFGTGFRYRTTLAAVSVKMGGADAEVYYAGPQGVYIGLDQANVLIPGNLGGTGVVEVVLMADGRVTNKVQFTVK